MSSEARSLRDSPAPVRRRLHSVMFLVLMRVFAVLLLVDAGRVVHRHFIRHLVVQNAFDGLLHVTAFVLMAYLLWFRARRIFATHVGLELWSGGAVRVVPWRDVAGFREVSVLLLHPPWYPKCFQVDLIGGETLEFWGRRRARDLVAAIRSSPPSAETPSGA